MARSVEMVGRIPILVIEGSGRTADNISEAYRTRQTDNRLVRAIIKGVIFV